MADAAVGPLHHLQQLPGPGAALLGWGSMECAHRLPAHRPEVVNPEHGATSQLSLFRAVGPLGATVLPPQQKPSGRLRVPFVACSATFCWVTDSRDHQRGSGCTMTSEENGKWPKENADGASDETDSAPRVGAWDDAFLRALPGIANLSTTHPRRPPGSHRGPGGSCQQLSSCEQETSRPWLGQPTSAQGPSQLPIRH